MEGVVDRMGLRFEADGFSRIAGRVLGHLMITTGALSLDELADALRVSRTSANTNCRMLERLGVIERVTHPADRRDYYRARDDLHERLLGLRQDHLREMRDLLRDAEVSPEVEDERAKQRLHRFASFFGYMLEAVEQAGAAWMATADDKGAGRTAGLRERS